MNELKLIADLVCRVFKIDIRSKKRNHENVIARAIYYRLCTVLLNPVPSLEKIGTEVNRDHATVLHSKFIFDNDVLTDEKLVLLYQRCKDIYQKKSNESRTIVLINAFLNCKQENKELKLKLLEREEDFVDAFIMKLKCLPPERYKEFQKRSEVILKSIEIFN